MSCVKSDTFPIGRNNPNNPLLNKVNPYTWNMFFIPIQIQGADKTWKPFKAQLDSGADVTTLTKETGDALGFTAAMGKAHVTMGVGGGSTSSISMRVNLKIGRLEPMNVEVNIAQAGVLKNNFLGNQSLVTSGRFVYTLGKDSVTVTDTKVRCNPATEAKSAFASMEHDNTAWYFS